MFERDLKTNSLKNETKLPSSLTLLQEGPVSRAVQVAISRCRRLVGVGGSRMTEISLSQVWRLEVHDQGAGPFCSRREPPPGLQMATRRRAWRRGRGGSELSLSAREGTDLVTRAPPSCPRCLCNRCRHFGDSGFNISTGVGRGAGHKHPAAGNHHPPS